eukprot:CAMPEP_0201506474 /NCGR_PEP_ID=MMETSP0161_2-20130828/387_1 /ASSEMBLY_ACC=CAM_ASM_000251 /TAXON_ID=180227 /ORGANISM="Neoparamoeba aestuarina, Strain SoJaBio B1-5/56/2" /LENGTH=41 /DNA_ID= /DNA_START= /DNA_END= /DNA_ORIENTATION=
MEIFFGGLASELVGDGGGESPIFEGGRRGEEEDDGEDGGSR